MSFSFLDLLGWHDEFVFIYNGTKYEIVNENGVSIYHSDGKHGTFISSYKDRDDLLINGYLMGHRILDILDDIVII